MNADLVDPLIVGKTMPHAVLHSSAKQGQGLIPRHANTSKPQHTNIHSLTYRKGDCRPLTVIPFVPRRSYKRPRADAQGHGMVSHKSRAQFQNRQHSQTGISQCHHPWSQRTHSSGGQTEEVPFQGWLVQLKYLTRAERKYKSFR
jgi:hypothetical protein